MLLHDLREGLLHQDKSVRFIQRRGVAGQVEPHRGQKVEMLPQELQAKAVNRADACGFQMDELALQSPDCI